MGEVLRYEEEGKPIIEVIPGPRTDIVSIPYCRSCDEAMIGEGEVGGPCPDCGAILEAVEAFHWRGSRAGDNSVKEADVDIS